MLDPESHENLRRELAPRILADRGLLDGLRSGVRPVQLLVTRIQPRATASISLVATDGGNNSLEFDPFLVQLIRVVDSRSNEYCLRAVTPTTSVSALVRAQLDQQNSPVSPLGEMMRNLRLTTPPPPTQMF